MEWKVVYLRSSLVTYLHVYGNRRRTPAMEFLGRLAHLLSMNRGVSRRLQDSWPIYMLSSRLTRGRHRHPLYLSPLVVRCEQLGYDVAEHWDTEHSHEVHLQPLLDLS